MAFFKLEKFYIKCYNAVKLCMLKGIPMQEDKREYYIVNKKILSNAIQKVIKVSELIQKESISKYEAIKKVGISRSTYYKYKDYVRPFFEAQQDKVFSLYLVLEDRTGVLSKILDLIAGFNMNVLTIIQNIPVDSIAQVTISVQIKSECLSSFEDKLEQLRRLSGVKDIRIIANT